MDEVPHMMSVEPTLTDPRMQNEKSGARPTSQDILNELGDANSDIKRTIFNDKQTKTNEERLASETQGMSTMLIIVFALIVIALVALIVWMVVKQNKPTTEEELELKARMRPHPRNMMPANMRQQMAMQQMAQQQQQQMTQQQQQMAQQRPVQQQVPQQQQVQQQQVQQRPSNTLEVIQEEPAVAELAAKAVVAAKPLTMPPDTLLAGDDDVDDIISKTNAIIGADDELNEMDRMMLEKSAETLVADAAEED